MSKGGERMSIPFMNPIQPKFNATSQSTQKPLVLNEGQMIHGKIQQLFPGQLAEVQVGDHKMFAKLEVPMRAGDSYYFQVTGVQPEVKLKIISGPTGAQISDQQQLQNLMQAMQLPKSPEMTKLLSFIIDKKIPISREGILQAVQLLQGTPENEQQNALIALQKVLDLKLPLTQNIFQAILGVETKEGLHPTMQSLKTVLQSDVSISIKARESMLRVLNQIEKPLGKMTSYALLGESLKALLNNEQTPELRFSTLQLLKESGIIPRQASLPNLQSTLTTTIANQIGLPGEIQERLSQPQLARVIQFVSELGSLTNGQKESLITTVQRQGLQPFAQALIQMLSGNVASTPAQETNQSIQTLLSLLNANDSSHGSDKLMTLLQNAEQFNKKELQRLVQLAESTVSTAIDGKVMKDAMQTIFRSLGMNYESALLGKEVQSERFMQMLKPQLIGMINDPNVSAHAREVAEQFVVSINGSPLMSMENGVNHQLVMQLPLAFLGKKIEATLQWSGRMKEDKKIDADFARILFYLDLHSLQETVVDMQVQNRIVTVTVFNEDPYLKVIGAPLQEKLKVGLDSIGYTLSGVFFKGFLEAETEKNRKLAKKREVFEGGVDFRI